MPTLRALKLLAVPEGQTLLSHLSGSTYQALQAHKEKWSRCDPFPLELIVQRSDGDTETDVRTDRKTSLVVQGLRILLPMQGTQFHAWSMKSPHASYQLSS